MLCHFGRRRNGYVATRFILLSNSAESSATSGYVVVPERSGQSEAWASRNVFVLLVLLQAVYLINTVFNHM